MVNYTRDSQLMEKYTVGSRLSFQGVLDIDAVRIRYLREARSPEYSVLASKAKTILLSHIDREYKIANSIKYGKSAEIDYIISKKLFTLTRLRTSIMEDNMKRVFVLEDEFNYLFDEAYEGTLKIGEKVKTEL